MHGKLSEIGMERDQMSENCQQKEKRFLERITFLEGELDSSEAKLKNCSLKIASYSDKCNEKIQEQYQKHADSEHNLENCQNELSNVKTQSESCQVKYTEALKIIKSLRGSNFDQPANLPLGAQQQQQQQQQLINNNNNQPD